MSSIIKERFGETSTGQEVYKFTLTNSNDVKISILNFGCIIYEILLPDKDGNITDVNLGFDNLEDYKQENNNYFGALCGRVANRIEANITIDGHPFCLSKNDPINGHYVHGGHVGFSRRVWSWSIKDDELILHYVDPDGSEGMPGEVITYVTYTLDDDNTLRMDYKATTNAPTLIDMGSHFMVNLAGHSKGAIRDHFITIDSDSYLEMGSRLVPTCENAFVKLCEKLCNLKVLRMNDFGTTLNECVERVLSEIQGKIVSVDEDVIMDFKNPRSLEGALMEQLSGGWGICHSFVFNDRGQKKFMARVDHPESKRYMEVYSTNTTVFAYSNHFMKDIMKDKPCKDGVVYEKYAAIEFMPMGYPNSINQPSFPQSVVRPDGVYHETAWYKFGVAD